MARPQTKGFAAATAEATGQDKRTTNRAIARADALGEETLAQVANTSLDSGVELDALAKLDAPERAQLIERAVAGEQVSARAQTWEALHPEELEVRQVGAPQSDSAIAGGRIGRGALYRYSLRFVRPALYRHAHTRELRLFFWTGYGTQNRYRFALLRPALSIGLPKRNQKRKRRAAQCPEVP